MLDALKRLVGRAPEPGHNETTKMLDDLRAEKAELLSLLAQASVLRSEWRAATAEATGAMEDQLRRQQQQAQQLTSSTMYARATLDTLAAEREALDALRDALR